MTISFNPQIDYPLSGKGYVLDTPCDKAFIERLVVKISSLLDDNNHSYSNLEKEYDDLFVAKAHPELAKVILEDENLPENIRTALQIAVLENVMFSLDSNRYGSGNAYIVLHNEYLEMPDINMTSTNAFMLLSYLNLPQIEPGDHGRAYTVVQIENAVRSCPRAIDDYTNRRIDQLKQLCAFMRKINRETAEIYLG
jgi:hypothetical protein